MDVAYQVHEPADGLDLREALRRSRRFQDPHAATDHVHDVVVPGECADGIGWPRRSRIRVRPEGKVHEMPGGVALVVRVELICLPRVRRVPAWWHLAGIAGADLVGPGGRPGERARCERVAVTEDLPELGARGAAEC